MYTNGTAKFTDFAGYRSFMDELTVENAHELRSFIQKAFREHDEEYQKSVGRYVALDQSMAWHLSVHGGWSNYPESENEESKWSRQREERISRVDRIYEFSSEFNQDICVYRWMDGVAALIYIGNAEKCVLVPYPEKFMEYIPEKDYSSVSPMELKRSFGLCEGKASGNDLIPSNISAEISVADMRKMDAQQQKVLDDIQSEMDDVKKAASGELAALRMEIERKKLELEKMQAARMEELNRRLQEAEQMKEQMDNEIYLLDSQIYAIRCYAGEVVKFTHIRSGKNAPITEPIVVHQKLRFLDEELGRLASLYSIQWDEVGMFEKFLQHHPAALDTFAPNERCIMLVRMSRSGKEIARSDRTPWDNVLREYEYWHGKTVGIIIRNGENLYLGWTEESRVHIQDDLLISQVVTEVAPAKEPHEYESEWEKKRRIKEEKEQVKNMVDGIISRRFVYSILQGVVDNTDILPLPDGITLGKQSPYVVYAVADKWLVDNKYGSLKDIIEAGNSKVTKGDMVLTAQKIVPERVTGMGSFSWNGRDQTWQNTRGRGERNRTHDCSVDDCTVYPINLVEYEEPVPMVRYRYRSRGVSGAMEWKEGVIQKERLKNLCLDDLQAIGEYEKQERHVFVSCHKKYTYTRDFELSTARANLELYDEEYINLTYLNSVLLEWVITNKNLGGWSVGGQKVDYAYAIRYLNTAMEFVKKREVDEKSFIDAVNPDICKDSDWPQMLTKWKMEAGVRAINAYQAKRFATWMVKQKEGD